jgi:hypothetical protein
MSKNFRRRIWIDHEVQLSLLWLQLKHWGLFLAVLSSVLFLMHVLAVGPDQPMTSQLLGALSEHVYILLVVVVLVPVFLYDSIKLSNRFAGPILRLRRAMHSAAQGESVAPLHFRTRDFWQALADDFNAVLRRLPAAPQSLDEQNAWNSEAESCASDQPLEATH